MTDRTTEEKVALIKDILIIILIIWVLIYTFCLFLDGFQIIDFIPGLAEGSG